MNQIIRLLPWVLILGNGVFIVIQLPSLPDIIPTHFNGAGEIDGWGNKYTIIIPFIIQLVMTLLLSYLAKHPEKHNYPFAITDENRDHQYALSSELISKLNLIINIIFVTISYSIVKAELPLMLIVSELILLFAAIIGHLVVSGRKR
jgi:uncharacterized membrane protein